MPRYSIKGFSIVRLPSGRRTQASYRVLCKRCHQLLSESTTEPGELADSHKCRRVDVKAQWVTYEVIDILGGSGKALTWWIALIALPEVADIGATARLGLSGAGQFTTTRAPAGQLTMLQDGTWRFRRLVAPESYHEIAFRSLTAVPPAQLVGTGWPGAPVGRPSQADDMTTYHLSGRKSDIERWKLHTADFGGGLSGYVAHVLNARFPPT